MKVVVASRNPGKLAEYRQMLQRLGVEVVSADQAGTRIHLPEDGDSFEANARSKALALQRHAGGWVLGDDSGLEVDALGGAPGVFSARYAGFEGKGVQRDLANIEKLLSDLQGVPEKDRSARFVCVIALLGPGDQQINFRGTCAGRIILSPRGSGGFGYDPVFVPEGFVKTMAELSMDEKNRISHRGRALAALAEKIHSMELNE